MRLRGLRVVAGIACVALLLVAFALGRHTASHRPAPGDAPRSRASLPPQPPAIVPTTVYAHNLLLRKGEHFRIYVRWIRGKLLRTQPEVTPSFDAPQSFVLQIDKGIVSVQLKDLADFLNAGTGTGSSLKNIRLQGSGSELELHGILHKLVPLPVKVKGNLTPLPDGRVQFHLLDISMLKLPVKGLLGAFHVDLSDLVASPRVPGVEIAGNDIRFNTETLLPPPHIHGQLTDVVISPSNLKIIYGHASDEEGQLARWHNFLRFTGGTLRFGKLSMSDVDLTMIDATPQPWFDLDLVNYQAQLVNGYTRVTAQSGLELYMPDLEQVKQKKMVTRAITLDWLKNRDATLPSDVHFGSGKPAGP